jgi:type VI secretion system protein VasG
MRGNPYVELVHWLYQILQLQDSDLHHIVRHFGLDFTRLARDVTATLDSLPRGSTADFAANVEDVMERGWVYATLMCNQLQVRTGHLFLGILKTRGLSHTLTGISREFSKIDVDTLTAQFDQIVDNSPEAHLMTAVDGSQLGGVAPTAPAGEMAPAPLGKQEALRQFSTDLTEKARQGEIDPIVARDAEIRQIVDILMRRRQNNPLLTGEAGVGKTAVVEGLALRIAAGDVPPALQNVSLRALDVGLLQAGASYRGEFEKRLRQVIDEVHASEKPIILFIDEAHMLIGAGGPAGTGDAANLLKPALARGTLRTIAATTWGEYKKIEEDPALTRRFQVVQIHEPNEEKAIRMIRGMASVMEHHHRVQVLDEALEAAVGLSHRYIPARQLPDKAVSLLDTACARVAISQQAVPAEVDDCRQRISALETELEIMAREKDINLETAERETDIATRLVTARQRLQQLEARWAAEKSLVDQILALRKRLRTQAGNVVDVQTGREETAQATDTADNAQEHRCLRAELQMLLASLRTLQGETPLIFPTVDAQAVAMVVADWTGIPVGRMVKNELETVLNLAESLNRRILGQRHALDMIARRIQTSRAILDDPNKPIGVFMLVGPSGVGKTETALALAEALYGGEQHMVTINMSEFQQAESVATLKGAPPGYVGYGKGGVLTEAVRHKPYSVILLDEVEKAHADVHEMFFQVFDKGWMEDAEGRFIDFTNTLILLTTNIATERIITLCQDPELLPTPDGLARAVREPLLAAFPAALLGRLVTIPYYPLSHAILADIVRLQLDRIARRIGDHHKIAFTYDTEVVDHMVSRCTEYESGGRMIDTILTNTVLPRISQEILTCLLQTRTINSAHLSLVGGEFIYAFA